MTGHHHPSCNRRQILTGTVLTGTAALMSVLAVPGLSIARAPGDQRLIVIILRGGLDGLAAVPPYGDPAYRAARGKIAIADPGAAQGAALDLDGFFGLNPAMPQLHQFYKKGQMAVFHAVASPYRERSHFDAQNLLELGTTAPHERRDGWLNRALSLMGPSMGIQSSQLGIAFAQTVPLILNGAVPVLSWVPGDRDIDPDFLARLGQIYARDPLFQQTLAQAVDAETMTGINGGKTGTRRRNNSLTRQQIEAATRMIGPDTPHRVAVLDVGGWDTHANQGTGTGLLANQLQKLDEGLGFIAEAMGPLWPKTAIVVMTEFGRTVAANGTGGTDHGTAGMALLLGGSVNGGYVLSKWPGLASDRLYQGRDLAPTLDIRAILKGVLAEHFGLAYRDLEQTVFPNSQAAKPARQLFRV